MKKFKFFAFVLLMISFPFTGKSQTAGENKEELSISVDKKDASSETASDGFITIKISGGTGPYKIHCFSPYSLPSQTDGSELKMSKIKSGDYLFVIQDNNGLRITREVKIDVK